MRRGKRPGLHMFCRLRASVETLGSVENVQDNRMYAAGARLGRVRRHRDRRPLCRRCGQRGELIGYIHIPGGIAYAQYRCRGCGHGFMLPETDVRSSG